MCVGLVIICLDVEKVTFGSMAENILIDSSLLFQSDEMDAPLTAEFWYDHSLLSIFYINQKIDAEVR